MNHEVEQSLRGALRRRAQSDRLRTLTIHHDGVDFCSNDYLGLSRSPELRRAIDQQRAAWHNIPAGSTGSRLISGNSALAESVEQELAEFHGGDAGLLFSSGFAANLGLYSAVAKAGDCLVMDELVHASSIDGARLSKAEKLKFKHNDLGDLERKLDQARATAEGCVFVGIESLYSMDGDFAPLEKIIPVARNAVAAVIIDEAHSNGIMGPAGAGLVSELGLADEVFARVHTFGKGMGLHGAVVLGSAALKSYLVNFSRPFIFSTGPSHDQLLAIRAAYRLLPDLDDRRRQLLKLVDHFRRAAQSSQLASQHPSLHGWVDSDSWVQSIIVPGEEAALAAADQLQARGFWVKAIRAPSVAAGTERIRICLHAFNTANEIDDLLAALAEVLKGSRDGRGEDWGEHTCTAASSRG